VQHGIDVALHRETGGCVGANERQPRVFDRIIEIRRRTGTQVIDRNDFVTVAQEAVDEV